MSELAALRERREKLAEELAALEGKTDYTADGRTFHWLRHRKWLSEEIERLDEQIRAMDLTEVISRGIT
jgi:hypothetical protein